MLLQNILLTICLLLILISGIIINLSKKSNSNIKSFDKKSLLLFRILIPFSLTLSLSIYFLKLNFSFSTNILILIGSLLVFLGLTIRWIAVLTLKESFTVSIEIQVDQKLKTNGIYTYIRHPSYTGLLVYYLGLGLLMTNYLSLTILIIGPLIAVLYRINKEELMLKNHFSSAFVKYSQKSKKIIPFIY